MQHVFPNYYKQFSCIKGECRHSCCVGWEIDIDSETLLRYKAQQGEIGERLRRHISCEGTPHFILGAHERCPFLNTDGLCDLILTCGADILCDICREHPRFHNELPERIESGLGLCCEEAARIILGTRECMTLIGLDGTPSDDGIINLRDEIITILQNRTKTIGARVSDMLEHLGAAMPDRNIGAWTELLLSLECLDPAWTALIIGLKRDHEAVDPSLFDAYMRDRETEYEQLLIYLVYRYTANAFDEVEAAETALFAVFSYELLRALGAYLYMQSGKFDFEDQVELVRLFSSEIEYCEENVEAIKDFLRA